MGKKLINDIWKNRFLSLVLVVIVAIGIVGTRFAGLEAFTESFIFIVILLAFIFFDWNIRVIGLATLLVFASIPLLYFINMPLIAGKMAVYAYFLFLVLVCLGFWQNFNINRLKKKLKQWPSNQPFVEITEFNEKIINPSLNRTQEVSQKTLLNNSTAKIQKTEPQLTTNNLSISQAIQKAKEASSWHIHFFKQERIVKRNQEKIDLTEQGLSQKPEHKEEFVINYPENTIEFSEEELLSTKVSLSVQSLIKYISLAFVFVYCLIIFGFNQNPFPGFNQILTSSNLITNNTFNIYQYPQLWLYYAVSELEKVGIIPAVVWSTFLQIAVFVGFYATFLTIFRFIKVANTKDLDSDDTKEHSIQAVIFALSSSFLFIFSPYLFGKFLFNDINSIIVHLSFIPFLSLIYDFLAKLCSALQKDAVNKKTALDLGWPTLNAFLTFGFWSVFGPSYFWLGIFFCITILVLNQFINLLNLEKLESIADLYNKPVTQKFLKIRKISLVFVSFGLTFGLGLSNLLLDITKFINLDLISELKPNINLFLGNFSYIKPVNSLASVSFLGEFLSYINQINPYLWLGLIFSLLILAIYTHFGLTKTQENSYKTGLNLRLPLFISLSVFMTMSALMAANILTGFEFEPTSLAVNLFKSSSNFWLGILILLVSFYFLQLQKLWQNVLLLILTIFIISQALFFVSLKDSVSQKNNNVQSNLENNNLKQTPL